MVDIYQIAKDALSFLIKWNKQKVRKMPLGQFIKVIEMKAGTQLSQDSKEEIIQNLIDSGEIKVITSRAGKRYVLLGDLV